MLRPVWRLMLAAVLLTSCSTATVTATATVTETATPDRVVVPRIPESCEWAARSAAYVVNDYVNDRGAYWERRWFNFPPHSDDGRRASFELALLETSMWLDLGPQKADIRACMKLVARQDG
jgi:hypothetical protein